MSTSAVQPPYDQLLAAADAVAAARPEVDLEMAREVFLEAATLLDNGLALDGLDEHDASAVVAGLCVDLVSPDPGAAVRARSHGLAGVRDNEVHAQPGDDRAGVVFVEAVEGEPVVEQGRRLEEHLTGHLEVDLGPVPGDCLGGREELVERWVHRARRHGGDRLQFRVRTRQTGLSGPGPAIHRWPGAPGHPVAGPRPSRVSARQPPARLLAMTARKSSSRASSSRSSSGPIWMPGEVALSWPWLTSPCGSGAIGS